MACPSHHPRYHRRLERLERASPEGVAEYRDSIAQQRNRYSCGYSGTAGDFGRPTESGSRTAGPTATKQTTREPIRMAGFGIPTIGALFAP